MQHPALTTPAPTASSVLLLGGTDTTRSPPIVYTQQVTLPLLRRTLGIQAFLSIYRRGFYPRVCCWNYVICMGC